MKKQLFLIFAIALFSCKLFGQQTGVYFSTDGRLGVGTTVPNYPLDVKGLINTTEGIRFSDGTILNSKAGLGSDSIWRSIGSSIVYDKGPVYIGGESVSIAPLVVSQNNATVGTFSNTVIAMFGRNYNGNVASLQIYGYPDSPTIADPLRKSVMLYAAGKDAKDLIFCAVNTDGNFRFVVSDPSKAENEKMRLSEKGFLGIGTVSPKSKLQIANGDVYISDINKGIIMKSPDGQCWRGTLDNTGALIFSSIACPESIATKTSETIQSSEIKIYPNPSKGEFIVELPSNESCKILIYNTEGKLIDTIISNSDYQTVSLKNQSQGIYFIRVYNDRKELIGSEKVVRN